MKNIIQNNKYRIKAIIRRFTGSYNEDIEQEIYIKAWKNSDKYKEQNKFSKWISTISANVCKDYLKSKQYKIQSMQIYDEQYLEKVNFEEETAKIIDSKLRQKAILKAVDELPKKLKEIIFLYEFEEKSYEEISKKLNIPQGTVKSRLFNGRKILNEKLIQLKGD